MTAESSSSVKPDVFLFPYEQPTSATSAQIQSCQTYNISCWCHFFICLTGDCIKHLLVDENPLICLNVGNQIGFLVFFAPLLCQPESVLKVTSEWLYLQSYQAVASFCSPSAFIRAVSTPTQMDSCGQMSLSLCKISSVRLVVVDAAPITLTGKMTSV